MTKTLLLGCTAALFSNFAFAQTPVVIAAERTAALNINGNPSETIWKFTNAVSRTTTGTNNNTVKYAVLYDNLYLYVAVTVVDAKKTNDSQNDWDDDAIEIFIDAENNGGTTYGVNDRQFIKGYNSKTLWEKTGKTANVLHEWSNISNGYAVELRIPWSNIGVTNPAAGFLIGFDVANDDDDNGGTRDSQVMWAGDINNATSPQAFGDLALTSADIVAPGPPANLTANVAAQTSINLSWTAATDNVGVTGYDVYQNGTKINTSLVTTLSYSVSGLTPGTPYQYYVIARDAVGNSSVPGNTASVTIADTDAPTAPAGLAASAISAASLVLNWTASADNVGVVGYDVYQDGVKVNASPITANSYNVSGLVAETTYAFYIVAIDAAGNTATGTPIDVTTGSVDTQSPTDPLNLSATNLGLTKFTLSWNASTDNVGVAGYDVYNNGTRVNTSLVPSASYVVTGLTPGTSYSMSVVAVDASGNRSDASVSLNVTTLLPTPGTETFTQRTVIARQRMPHDLVYGPDNNIWYNERFAGTVSFVNPATGVKRIVLTLGSNMARTGGQDGLMGLALHPAFTTGKPYVYISYTYQSVSATVRKIRIERYTYNSTTQTLGSPVTILQDIPGSNDHNSARLAIGPDQKLYFTIGDMGAGQFDNTSRANNAQNLNVLEGKVLRLNTELTNNTWVPADNPFANGGVVSPVYTLGHRNPQGLVWGNVNGSDILYSSEHGPYSDDELNVIQVGRNYGWPQVAGFCDGNYNGRTIGGFAVVSEQNNCTALNVKEPIKSLFPVATPPTDATNNMTWPSTAPSGTEFYGSNAIPGWQNSLLVAQLKAGAITRFKLSNDGQSIISDTIHYFRGKGRFRDVVVSPDGLKLYVACDSSGSTSGPTGGVTTTPANPGSILEFTYQAPVGARAANESLVNNISELKSDKSVDIYPNPANDFVVVYNYNTTGKRHIELQDMAGRIVRKQLASQVATRLETTNLASGVYLVKVVDEKGKIIRMEKVLIRH